MLKFQVVIEVESSVYNDEGMAILNHCLATSPTLRKAVWAALLSAPIGVGPGPMNPDNLKVKIS